MSRFHESIRIILTDVEQFLVESLKSVTLPTSPEQHRQRLLVQINIIRSQFPNLNLPEPLSNDELNEPGADNPNVIVDDRALTGSESSNSLVISPTPSSAGPQDFEDETYSDTIAPIAAVDLIGAQKTGVLSKKRKPGDIRAKLNPYQKRWSVIKGSVFYYYEKQTDKKQCGAFSLSGYEFRDAPYLEKDANKKELCFELNKPGSRNFQFIAMNKQDYSEWKAVIERAVVLAPPDRPTPAPNAPPATTDNGVTSGTPIINDDEEIYEPIDDMPVLERPKPPTNPPPNMAVRVESEEIYDDIGSHDSSETQLERPKPPANPPPNTALQRVESEEIYDDIGSHDSSETQLSGEIYHDALTIDVELRTTDVTGAQIGMTNDMTADDIPRPESDIYDDIGHTRSFLISEEIYDDIGNMDQTVPSNGVIYPDHRGWKIGAWDDYENIYCCKWDCTADRSDHLAFKHGDLIHILSKEYDKQNWWIGEFGGKIGLVPKTYLTEAYEAA